MTKGASQTSFNLNLNSNPKKISILENDDRKLSAVSLKDIQEIVSKNPSNQSLQALKIIMEEEEKIVNIISKNDDNNIQINKIINEEID